jgi:acyl carrier protein
MREKVASKILSLFRGKEVMRDVGEEDNFFDLGVSSLTVVELQILVEKALSVAVSTSELMGAPTIKQWIDLYTKKINEASSQESAPVAG